MMIVSLPVFGCKRKSFIWNHICKILLTTKINMFILTYKISKAMIRKSKNGRTYRKQPVDERGRKVHSEYIFELHTEQEVITP